VFGRGDFVVVVDVNHGKALAVGEALFGVDEARASKQGAVVSSVHFVGDKIWSAIRQMEARER
jgi:predicted RNA-binding protein (TIGR00451 family)